MTTARALTRQRRAGILNRKRLDTLQEQRDRLPIERQVAHVICSWLYPANGCACDAAPDKSTCDRMEGIGRHIVDTVRRHDRKQAEASAA